MIQNRKYLYTDVNGMEVRDDVAFIRHKTSRCGNND